jgi:NTE family protein
MDTHKELVRCDDARNNVPGKMIIVSLFIIIAAAGWSCPVAAEPSAPEKPDRPKIGLVLGGGGAKGNAHIGVLKVLEELKIPIDYIAGTSMGSIVGSLYASGLSADEIETLITSIDWKDVFSGKPERKDIDFRRKREDFEILSGISLGVEDGEIQLPKGLVKDQKVNVLFEVLMLHIVEINDFDKLPIPFRAVATDLETGEMVVLKKGRLSDAARASMSVPGAFPPVEVDGRILIDGGIVRNLPVDIVREMGADIIICIDVGKPLPTRKDLKGPLSILNQMVGIMMEKNVEDQIKTLGPKDIYINPKLGKLGSGDFDKAAEISIIGEKAAREHIAALSKHSVSDSEYAAFTKKHHRDEVKEVKITSMKVEIEGDSGMHPEVVAGRLDIKEGDTADLEDLEENAGRVYGTGDFERVDMRMKRERDGYDLTVKAKEKSWGPNYIRFGMALESDFQGVSSYNILVDYTRRWINSLGAEWKTQIDLGSPNGIYSEFYQPITKNRLFFVSPHVRWEQKPVDFYNNNDIAAEYRVSTYEFGLDLGIQPMMYGEAKVGLLFGRGKAKLETGEVKLPNDRFDRRGIIVEAALDQIDNVNFPNEGYFAGIKYFSSIEDMGSDDSYNKVEGSAIAAFTFKKQTVLASFEAGSHFGGELPYYDQLLLGGFLDLSGLQQNQLRGQYMAIGKVVTYHRMGSSIIGDLYLGGSLESGNVWQNDFDFDNLQTAGSIFLGYDTILGPLYIALGYVDQGQRAGYFYLGRTF